MAVYKRLFTFLAGHSSSKRLAGGEVSGMRMEVHLPLLTALVLSAQLQLPQGKTKSWLHI